MSDTCLNCGGLIMEQGKTYGYAGPVCHCPKNPAHRYQRPASKEAQMSEQKFPPRKFIKNYSNLVALLDAKQLDRGDEYLSLAEHEARLAAAEKRIEKLRRALEELRDAACTAVNWQSVIEAQVGAAPWISQGDANEVDLAVLKANEALAEDEKVEK